MFNVDFYTDVLDLQQLLSSLEEDMDNSKYTKLNTAMISLIEDYSLVSFHLLNVNDDESILKLKNVIDKVMRITAVFCFFFNDNIKNC